MPAPSGWTSRPKSCSRSRSTSRSRRRSFSEDTSRRGVLVVPYDASWPQAFEEERQSLAGLLGPAAVAIHHVGSTSVPGLAAKPVMDIALETPSLAAIDEITPALEQHGYEARGEYGIPERRYFSRPAGAGPKVHLHVFEVGHPQIARHLRFRDYLRAHPDVAAGYGALKQDLGRRHATDRDAYQAAKADFVATLQERATDWSRERQ